MVTSMILNGKHIWAHLIFTKPAKLCIMDIPITLMGKLKNRVVEYFNYGYTTYTPRAGLEFSSYSVDRVWALDYYNSTSSLRITILLHLFQESEYHVVRGTMDWEPGNPVSHVTLPLPSWLTSFFWSWFSHVHSERRLELMTYKTLLLFAFWVIPLIETLQLVLERTAGEHPDDLFQLIQKSSAFCLFAPLHITIPWDSNREPNIPRPQGFLSNGLIFYTASK